MKRCPRCNAEFTDEWLTFCTQDGTSLIEVQPSPDEPPPTLLSADMPPSVSPAEQPTLDLPGRYTPPPAQYIPPAPIQPGWKPPPPPPYPAAPQQGLAAASLVLGIVSITVGWCCSFGVITAPVAVVLGIVALVQIKNDPKKNAGKGMAIGGIATGGVYIFVLAIIILIYGIGIIAAMAGQ
jgi:hypothetical protein